VKYATEFISPFFSGSRYSTALFEVLLRPKTDSAGIDRPPSHRSQLYEDGLRRQHYTPAKLWTSRSATKLDDGQVLFALPIRDYPEPRVRLGWR
jgi:hypothetical protein